MCEQILTPELTTSLEYMTWFRYHDKSYILLEEERTRQRLRKRPRQPRINLRSRVHASMESLSTSNPQVAPMAAPPPDKYGSYYSSAFINVVFYTQTPHYALLYHVSIPSASVFFAPPLSPALYKASMPTTTPTYPPSLTILTFYPQLGYATPYTYSLILSLTPPTLLFYQGDSSLQPPVIRMADLR
ncbi:hypothetical protein Goari_009701 [Gossypium aridum]|uniref:Uncharacterized protein n=1 Tax=Gossypium aridum TaxID=34290 RepID=A0A7J8XXU3_GOSAI|nr:hypothetical protein [Gossypium aridum]